MTQKKTDLEAVGRVFRGYVNLLRVHISEMSVYDAAAEGIGTSSL